MDNDFFKRGNCKGLPVEFFFPKGVPGRKKKGAPTLSGEDVERENAKLCKGIFCKNLSEDQVLTRCPVIEDCLDYALRNNEPGVFGGTSSGERAAMREVSLIE